MVAGVLVILVFVNPFLTGWLLRDTKEHRREVAELREVSAVHAHDLDILHGVLATESLGHE